MIGIVTAPRAAGAVANGHDPESVIDLGNDVAQREYDALVIGSGMGGRAISVVTRLHRGGRTLDVRLVLNTMPHRSLRRAGRLCLG